MNSAALPGEHPGGTHGTGMFFGPSSPPAQVTLEVRILYGAESATGTGQKILRYHSAEFDHPDCPGLVRSGPCGYWSYRARLGNLQGMTIQFENVGIAVRDLEAAISFFTDLGLIVVGRDTVSGEWTDTAVGLDGNHANIAMLKTPDGHGRLELFEYIHPAAIESEPTRPNEIGMHRVAFSVDDLDTALEIAARHGCRPLRGVATYKDVYKLTYVRGPSGIIVMLAEELKKN